jgi:ketosteroid isomerase-like protein
MSEDTVGLVRRAYEAWNEYGPEAMDSMLAEDVELHDAPQLPDAEVWRGREAVLARLKAVAEAMGGGTVGFEDIRASGEDVLVAMLWHLDRAAAEVELGEVFHLVHVEEGRIDRIRVFLTESEARAEASA